ncbi:MAG TPA: hypothetical protein PLP39_05240 [Flavobacterium lutivivi]|nr:hypothetical protein [Flavobacterium lutivivi]
MKYSIELNLSNFWCLKKTAETNDEICMTGFGVNDAGKVTVLPWRRIKSNTLTSFKTDDSINQLTGGNNLLTGNLKDRRNLNYQFWLWIVESDDFELLKREHNFNEEGLENEINREVEELSRLGYKNDTIYFQATANLITDFTGGIKRALYEHNNILGIGKKFEIFNPATIFYNCGKFIVTNPPQPAITDLNAGEYEIDNRLKEVSFRLNNSAEAYNEACYHLSYDIKLIASGNSDGIISDLHS